ncbi:cytochrome P450 [Phytohabitans rumicis]|nr:cytochrome P450 [Phytohabitans rumicis]
MAFPVPRTCPFDLPAGYAALRTERPVSRVRLPDGQLAWLVTRYEDVRRLATDPRISADRGHPNSPYTELVTAQGRAAIAAVGRSLIGLDPPEHGPRRRMLMPEFTVRRVNGLRPHIQRVVDESIAALLAGPRPAELVTALALPVTSTVICELLGVPYADRDFFLDRAAVQVRRDVPPERRRQAGGELRAYLDRLVTGKERDGGDDLLSRLAARRNAEFDHDQLVGLAMLLLIAGFESTASMIVLGVVVLLEHGGAAAVPKDPAALGLAVEELLRYLSIVDTMPRVATADIEVGGVTIPAGDGVLLSFASANHDADTFDDPAGLRLGRGSRQHVAFGYGAHQCLGQNLARAELEIVFRSLFTRVPGLRLAVPLADLPFKRDASVYGLDRLPVTW